MLVRPTQLSLPDVPLGAVLENRNVTAFIQPGKRSPVAGVNLLKIRSRQSKRLVICLMNVCREGHGSIEVAALASDDCVSVKWLQAGYPGKFPRYGRQLHRSTSRSAIGISSGY
jgi:hypothetical protein